MALIPSGEASPGGIELEGRAPSFFAIVDPKQWLLSAQMASGVQLLNVEPDLVDELGSGDRCTITHKPPKRSLR